MNEREIQNEKAIPSEILAQHAVHAAVEVSGGVSQLNTISPFKGGHERTHRSAPGNGSFEASDRRFDVAQLIELVRQLEGIAKRQCSRIAFKSNGRILFLDLAEIIAVQAEGNYVLLRLRPNSYVLRESLTAMAEKLRPYGFVRIHRSVVVNISAVDQIEPLP